MLNKGSRPGASAASPKSDEGFSMLEMVAAMLLLMIGLLAMASAIGYALTVSNRGRNVTNSKLLVVSILEQMETLRNTRQLTFGQIANVGKADNTNAPFNFAGFPSEPMDVSTNPGPDGIYGTSDDLLVPGAGGTYQTDPSLIVQGYKRSIIISNLSPDLKKVEVILYYPGANGQTETMSAISYLNNDARSNYLR